MFGNGCCIRGTIKQTPDRFAVSVRNSDVTHGWGFTYDGKEAVTMDLPPELQQFVDAIKAAVADSRITADEFALIAAELADCVAPLVDALDPENSEAIEKLVVAAVKAADAAIDALPNGRLGMKPLAKAGIEYVVPSLIRQAAKAAQPAHAWLLAHVTPKLASAEQIVHSFRVAFGG